MDRIWRSKEKITAEISQSALGDGSAGDIAVVINGTTLDMHAVSLACMMGRRAKRSVYLIHVIEVPRSLPLQAMLSQQSDAADVLLSNAMAIAEKIGCQTIPTVVQARNAGTAIVEEARDHRCALLFISWIRQKNRTPVPLDTITFHVLLNAPCRVWLIQDVVDPSTET